jgi:hypothetical protein
MLSLADVRDYRPGKSDITQLQLYRLRHDGGHGQDVVMCDAGVQCHSVLRREAGGRPKRGGWSVPKLAGSAPAWLALRME